MFRLPKNWGGLYVNRSIYEIVQQDQIIASALDSLSKSLILSPFRNAKKQYIVLYLIKKRYITLSQVRSRILQKLYVDREELALQNWLKNKRKKVIIVVHK